MARAMLRRSGGRPAGLVRRALREVIGAGLSGPADTLAALTGWPPESVCAALKEMRRSGELDALPLVQPPDEAGRGRGRASRVYQAAARAPAGRGPADALAFVQSVWR